MAPTEPVIVVVDLDVEAGWPPVAREELLAHPDGEGGFVLDETPAFALDLSLGDTVGVHEGTHRFERRITPGGHATYRLIALDGPASFDPVADRLATLGARVTPSGYPELWCVDVPPGVSGEGVRAALVEAASRGVLEFEDARTP